MRRPLPARFFASLLVSAAALAFAAAQPAFAADPPPGLTPVPDVPPPNVAADGDEPEVTITKRGEDKVEEYRMGGKLYMVKVTPPHGVPYYLVDDVGNGVLTKRDNIGPNVKPPMWVIHSF